MYDLLLKGGELIDPAQGIHEVRDLAIRDGKIAAVEKNVTASEALVVIPVPGRWVVPGLIDMHVHTLAGLRHVAMHPDELGVYAGVTTFCEGGSAGAANFHNLLKYGIEQTRTDMFSLINLNSTGLVPVPEILDEHAINPRAIRRVVEENRSVIKGIKMRFTEPLAKSLGVRAVEIAKELAGEVNLPLVMHIGEVRERAANDHMDALTSAAIKLLGKGDVLTHFMTSMPGGIVLPDGTIGPEVFEAREKGVVFDCCHGVSNFSFKVAAEALRQGLVPDIISTDASTNGSPIVQSLLVTMSKLLKLGLSPDQVIAATTINPARALGEEARRGSLRYGMPADVTVLELAEGDYLFSDGRGQGSLRCSQLIEPRLVVKNGALLPCRSYYHLPPIFTTIRG